MHRKKPTRAFQSLATSSSQFQAWNAQFGMVNSLRLLHLLLCCNKHVLVMQPWLCLGIRSPWGFESSPKELCPSALKARDFRLFQFGCFSAVTYSVAVCLWPASRPQWTERSLGQLQENNGIRNKVIVVCWETCLLHQGINWNSSEPEGHHQTGLPSSNLVYFLSLFLFFH